jgi:hypothetical protein
VTDRPYSLIVLTDVKPIQTNKQNIQLLPNLTLSIPSPYKLYEKIVHINHRSHVAKTLVNTPEDYFVVPSVYLSLTASSRSMLTDLRDIVFQSLILH